MDPYGWMRYTFLGWKIMSNHNGKINWDETTQSCASYMKELNR